MLEKLIGFLPTRCPLCKKWVLEKNTRRVIHRHCGLIVICEDCYRFYYTPWE